MSRWVRNKKNLRKEQRSYKENAMQHRVVSAAAAIGLALFSVGTAAPDGGNLAINSIGTVEISPITSDPAAAVDATLGSASSTLPVMVGGTSGNSSSSSIGTVLAGGDNTAARSEDVAQVRPMSACVSI